MQTLIDLIVPVYNRAHCIPALIGELEKQTFRRFRVIFVDDGSQDDSVAVLRRCLETSSFPYEIIQKENGGAASARNAGLRASTAPWIGFVDSDDGLLPQHLEQLYTAATQSDADFAVCGFQLILEGSGRQPQPSGEFTYETLTAAEYMRRYYTNWIGVVCMLINGSFQRSKELFFDENCAYHEDIPFITEVIAAANRVAQVNNALYLYLAHPGSLSRSPRMDKFLSGIQSFEKTADKLAQSPCAAAETFRTMAPARYYIATLRKAAVQMSYPAFAELAKKVDFRRFRSQIPQLSGGAKLASYLLLTSKRCFYYGVRTVFKD